MSAGISSATRAVEVLGFVVVELARRHDLAGDRRLGSSLPSTAHSISRASGTAASTTTLRSYSAASVDAPRRARSRVRAFEMPTLDPRLAGLTNTGKPRPALDRAGDDAAARRAQSPAQHDRVVRHDRQAVRARRALHHRLVHAHRRGEHAARRRTARWRARAAPAPCRPRRSGPCSTGKTTSRPTPVTMPRLVVAARGRRSIGEDASRRSGRGQQVRPRVRRAALSASVRVCSMTSAADAAVGGSSASTHRPSFSMRIGTGS